MAADYSSYKVASNEALSATKFDNLVQAVQDSVNNIGDTTKMGFAAGLIFDPASIKQNGATSGQALAWNGTNWAPSTLGSTSFVMLADSALVSDGTFSFTSISGSYRHLWLALYLRSDRAATEDNLGIRFNNDTAANYDAYSLKESGTTPTHTATESLAATSASLALVLTGNSASSGLVGSLHIVIPNYSDANNNKIFHATGGKKIGTTTGLVHSLLGMGAWRSNNAITRIDLLPTGGGTNFKAGSRATLYGM